MSNSAVGCQSQVTNNKYIQGSGIKVSP